MNTKKNASGNSKTAMSSLNLEQRIQYLKFSQAAQTLGCSTDELLHMGATGQIEVIAPVTESGEYAWPTGVMESGLIEIERPFVRYFDASSRVMLFPSDLARIEAVGWTIPWQFYSPTHAAAALQHAPRTFEQSLQLRHDKRLQTAALMAERFPETKLFTLRETDSPAAAAGMSAYSTPGTIEYEQQGLQAFREAAPYLPWTIVEAHAKDAARTTVDHLFVTRDEIERLQSGVPVSKTVPEPEIIGKPVHGNTERFAGPRFEVLFAALWAQRQEIGEVVKVQKDWRRIWREKIDLLAVEFWPTGRPPLEPRTIEDLLGDVLSDRGPEKHFRKPDQSQKPRRAL